MLLEGHDIGRDEPVLRHAIDVANVGKWAWEATTAHKAPKSKHSDEVSGVSLAWNRSETRPARGGARDGR